MQIHLKYYVKAHFSALFLALSQSGYPRSFKNLYFCTSSMIFSLSIFLLGRRTQRATTLNANWNLPHCVQLQPVVVGRIFCIRSSSPSSSCSAQGQVFHCKLRHKGCISAQMEIFHLNLRNQGCSFTRCGSFSLPSAAYSLFSFWTDLKRSEKFPGAPSWRRGEWIWLTGTSGIHLKG